MKVLKTIALILGFLLLAACVSGSSSGSSGTASSGGTVTGVTTVAQLSVVTAN